MIHKLFHMLGINKRYKSQWLNCDGKLFDVVTCSGCSEVESEERSPQCKFSLLEMLTKSIFPEGITTSIRYELKKYYVRASKPANNKHEFIVVVVEITSQMFDLDHVGARISQLKERLDEEK